MWKHNARIGDILRHFNRDERGNYIVMTALALPAVVGCFGFMSEAAGWYSSRQAQQNAADSAAISAALAVSAGESGHVALGRAVSGSNGYVHEQAAVTVAVNKPPQSGPNRTNNSAVEVIITKTVTPTFSAMFGQTARTVSARSVASLATTASCVVALSSNAPNALRIWGNASVDAPTCALVSRSSIAVGGSSTVKATSVSYATSASWSPKDSNLPGPNFVSPPSDPYADLAIPSPQLPCSNYMAGTSGPGTYCSMNLPKGTTTLAPGTYVINGPFSMKNGTVLKGAGVTLVFGPNATLGNVTNGSVEIEAPKSGAMRGIAMTSSRGLVGDLKFAGQSSLSVTGAIYLPGINLTYRGGAGATECTQIIANTVDFSGNSALKMNCAAYGVKSPGGTVALTE